MQDERRVPMNDPADTAFGRLDLSFLGVFNR